MALLDFVSGRGPSFAIAFRKEAAVGSGGLRAIFGDGRGCLQPLGEWSERFEESECNSAKAY